MSPLTGQALHKISLENFFTAIFLSTYIFPCFSYLSWNIILKYLPFPTLQNMIIIFLSREEKASYLNKVTLSQQLDSQTLPLRGLFSSLISGRPSGTIRVTQDPATPNICPKEVWLLCPLVFGTEPVFNSLLVMPLCAGIWGCLLSGRRLFTKENVMFAECRRII